MRCCLPGKSGAKSRQVHFFEKDRISLLRAVPRFMVAAGSLRQQQTWFFVLAFNCFLVFIIADLVPTIFFIAGRLRETKNSTHKFQTANLKLRRRENENKLTTKTYNLMGGDETPKELDLN